MYSPDPAAVGFRSVGQGGLPDSRRRTVDDALVAAIGNTPLVPLAAIAADNGGDFELWAKAEHLNPTGSVKDRTARGIVLDAISSGLLAPERTLVDASSGNTVTMTIPTPSHSTALRRSTARATPPASRSTARIGRT